MDITLFKILAGLILIGIGVTFGLIPYRVSVSKSGEKWLVHGNAFAGGIFLGAGMLHLLPDSNELLSGLSDAPEYPVAFLLASLGFLLILLLEQVFAQGKDEEEFVGADEESFPLILFLVLSIHSLIAGMALGLETMTAAFVAVFIAIIAHKAFAALALGISLVQGKVPLRRIVQTVVAFSIMTPLGLLIGTIFSTFLEGESARATEGIFDGLAAGTFIYISTFEMIGQVFDVDVNRIQNYLFVLGGFMVMALLAIWS